MRTALERAREQVMDEFRRYGSQGGHERARRLSPEERTRIARKAALARWRKPKPDQ